MRLLVVSPVRDEGDHLPALVEAMAAQRRKPDRWVIVDDGSTDATASVARDAVRRLPFCEFISAPATIDCPDIDGRLERAAEWVAFAHGLTHAGPAAYDLVAKLDGDVVPAPDWFAMLLDRVREDERLGIAGGTLYERRRGRLRRLRVPEHHVPGAIKLYRRTCLEAISLTAPHLGWDTVDEIRARAAGWHVQSFPAPTAEHRRPCGAGGRPLAGRARYGLAAWMLHQPPWWVMLRAVKLAVEPPRLVAAVAFLAGYARGALTRAPRIDDPLVRVAGIRPPAVPDRRRSRPWAPPARVLLITPTRNEARHLQRVARAVAAQTRPPARWVVVDDGSTDGTPLLLERLAREIPFLQVLQAPTDLTPDVVDRLAAAAAPRAFRWALRRTGLQGFTHVGKLDGDTELPPHYLETLLTRLEAQPGLGVAGGVRVEERGGRLVRLDRPGQHVPGALKLYSAPCWRAIGGMPETLGWDAIDEVRAHLHGYETRSYEDLVAVHHRPWGTAEGRLRGRFRFGRSLYVAGYPLWWVLPKALRVSTLPPLGISGVCFLWGYVDARLRRLSRVQDPAYVRQLHRDLRARAGFARRALSVAHEHADNAGAESAGRGQENRGGPALFHPADRSTTHARPGEQVI